MDAADEDGYTLLHLAVCERQPGTVALLAAAVAHLHVPPQLLRPSAEDVVALADEADLDHDDAVKREEGRPGTVVVLHRESRWRRRRSLALIREQRRAVRDAGTVHKEWEREKEAAARSKRKQQKRGTGER